MQLFFLTWWCKGEDPPEKLGGISAKVDTIPVEDFAQCNRLLCNIHFEVGRRLEESLSSSSQLLVDMCGRVCLDRRAGLGTADKSKMNTRFRKGKLQRIARVLAAERTEDSERHTPIGTQDAVFNVVETELVAANEVGDRAEELTALQSSAWLTFDDGGVNDQCVVDVNEEGDLLVSRHLHEVDALQLHGEPSKTGELRGGSNSKIVDLSTVCRQEVVVDLQDRSSNVLCQLCGIFRLAVRPGVGVEGLGLGVLKKAEEQLFVFEAVVVRYVMKEMSLVQFIAQDHRGLSRRRVASTDQPCDGVATDKARRIASHVP